jgi:hypothetical protein
MKRAIGIGGILAGLGLIGYALLAGESDEEQIRARLEQLEESVALDSEAQNVAVRALQLRGQFNEIFEPDVRARIPELGSTRHGREELATLAARSSSYFQSLDLQFEDLDIRIDDSSRQARVDSVALLTATRRGQAEPRRDERTVRFDFFNHEEHGWRITAVRVDEGEAEPPE